jgi:hypothetical protein
MATETPYPSVPEMTKNILYYLDGRKVNGEQINADAIKLDARILKAMRLRKLNREGQIANAVGHLMRDEPFQAALERLEAFGMITRTIRRWDYHGYWVELTDEEERKDDLSMRGEACDLESGNTPEGGRR